jgi:hypothetical protein
MFLLGHIGLAIILLFVILMITNKTEMIYELDLRIIAIMAILPDIIDKTIGLVIFAETINNGRLFSHTLLFMLIFAIIYFVIIGSKAWVYVFPVLMHQLLDLSWQEPKTWFWPAYGWEFEFLEKDVFQGWLDKFINDPFIFSTEIIGLVILMGIFFYFRVFIRDNFEKIIKSGQVVERFEKKR